MSTLRKDGPRPAVIGTCVFKQVGAASPETLLHDTLGMIDGMAQQAEQRGWQLDMAVLPECSFQFMSGSDVAELAEDLDGPFVRAVGAKAKQHSTYATAPIQTRRDGRVHNSVVIVDRQGRPAGVYSKVFPVMMGDGSLEYGITPGREFPVFDLDIGRVGVQICWDIAFDDGWQALADQDAELVVFCTNPAVPVAMRARGWRHGYYIAASTVHPPSMVVDPLGRELCRTSADREISVLRVDLDYRVLHSNCMWEWTPQRAAKYEGRVGIEWDVDAHAYLVTSSDPSLPVRRFLEVEGLLTGRQRVRRNIALQLEARGGAPTMPAAAERD
jgi:predicted amidohydrolase